MTLSESDLTTIFRALDYAAKMHRDQRRKGGEASPYVNHLIDVSRMLWEIGGVRDQVTITAAILHDTVEDTDTSQADIEREFGTETASVVMEVTDDKSLPKEVRKRLQVEHAPKLSTRAATIKIADKISNIKDILSSPPAGWSLQRKKAYVEWGMEVVSRIRGINPALERFFDETASRALSEFENNPDC